MVPFLKAPIRKTASVLEDLSSWGTEVVGLCFVSCVVSADDHFEYKSFYFYWFCFSLFWGEGLSWGHTRKAFSDYSLLCTHKSILVDLRVDHVR